MCRADLQIGLHGWLPGAQGEGYAPSVRDAPVARQPVTVAVLVERKSRPTGIRRAVAGRLECVRALVDSVFF